MSEKMTDAEQRLFDVYEAERLRLLQLDDTCGDYTNPVFGVGNTHSRIMFIGEAPGCEEAISHCPFVGKAGKQLDEMLQIAEIDRKTVFVTNAVKFRPIRHNCNKNGRETIANRTPTASEINAAGYVLEAEIEAISPTVIVTLGNTPLYSMLRILAQNTKQTVGTMHGEAIHLAQIVLFPLYHPASGIYRRELVDIMQADLIKLSEYIKTMN